MKVRAKQLERKVLRGRVIGERDDQKIRGENGMWERIKKIKTT